jgi:hypothetical protein
MYHYNHDDALFTPFFPTRITRRRIFFPFGSVSASFPSRRIFFPCRSKFLTPIYPLILIIIGRKFALYFIKISRQGATFSFVVLQEGAWLLIVRHKIPLFFTRLFLNLTFLPSPHQTSQEAHEADSEGNRSWRLRSQQG